MRTRSDVRHSHRNCIRTHGSRIPPSRALARSTRGIATALLIAAYATGQVGCGSSSSDTSLGGSGSPGSANPSAFTPAVILNGTTGRLDIEADASDVVLGGADCVLNQLEFLTHTDVDPSLGSPMPAETLQVTALVRRHALADGWLAFVTRSDCGSGVPLECLSRVFDTRSPIDASNPFTWPPANVQFNVFRMRTSDGWISWSGYLEGDPEPKLLLADLETNGGATWIEISSGPRIVSHAISAEGLLWEDPSDNTIQLLRPPFVSNMPVEIASVTNLDTLELDGASAFWIDSGELFVLDIGRAAPVVDNPRSLGGVDEVSLFGDRVAWTQAGDVYTLEIEDPSAVPDAISDPGFHDFDLVGSGDWVAWKRCTAAPAPATDCDVADAGRTIQVFDLLQPYSPGSNPVDVRGGLEEPVTLDVSPFGIAWTEGHDPTGVYFFDPLAPTVLDTNPVEVDRSDRDVSRLVMMDEGLVWVGGPRPGGWAALFVPRAELLAETNP